MAGIFAAAQIVLPKDCKGNKFCEIVKIIVGPTVKWYITGHFQWKNIRVATGFANVRIFDGLYFHKLELYVEVSCREGNRYYYFFYLTLTSNIFVLLCFRVRKATRFYYALYNNQINARALIGQSAVGYCAGKPSHVF